MITGLQLAILSGGLVGLGRRTPRRAPAACRAGSRRRAGAGVLDAISQRDGRRLRSVQQGAARPVGACASLPAGLWVRTPTRELALLRIPVAQFYGEKLMFAGLGLLIPPVLVTLFNAFGLEHPVPAPSRRLARTGRRHVLHPELQRARRREEGTARVRPCARRLHRPRRAGAQQRHRRQRQAMEAAAEVGDSWVFTRLSEELTRSRWSGLPPWDALHTLAEELGLPELDDFADIMRLSGEEGASVYATLRARSAAMRTAMLNDETRRGQRRRRAHDDPRLAARRHLHGAARRALTASDVHELVTTEGHIHRRKPMLKVLVLLQIAALSKYDDLRASRRSERGSVTTEHVLWAVAVIAIVGIVVAAVTTYVTTQAGKIK